MKKCTYCKVEKRLRYFPKHKGRKDGRGTACTKCLREYSAVHYQKNKEKRLSQTTLRRERIYKERYFWLFDYLSIHPCIECGEDDPLVLEFDHIDPSQKASVVSELIRGGSESKLHEEVKKCVVRCANCHRRKTFIENDTIRVRLWNEYSKENISNRC